MSRPEDKRPVDNIRGGQVMKVTCDDRAMTLTLEMPDRRVTLDLSAIDKVSDGILEYIREMHGEHAANMTQSIAQLLAMHLTSLPKKSKGN